MWNVASEHFLFIPEIAKPRDIQKYRNSVWNKLEAIYWYKQLFAT